MASVILAFLNYIFYHTKTQLEQSDIAKMKDHPMPKVYQMFHNTNMWCHGLYSRARSSRVVC